GVVAAAGIGDDFEQVAVQVGLQHCSGGQIQRSLFAHRVTGTVALARVIGVVEQRVGGLVAFRVDDADGFSGHYDADEVVACAHNGAFACVGQGKGTFFDHVSASKTKVVQGV